MFQENGYGTYQDEPSTSERQYQLYSRVRMSKIQRLYLKLNFKQMKYYLCMNFLATRPCDGGDSAMLLARYVFSLLTKILA